MSEIAPQSPARQAAPRLTRRQRPRGARRPGRDRPRRLWPGRPPRRRLASGVHRRAWRRLDAPLQDRQQLRPGQPLPARQRLLAHQLRRRPEPLPRHPRGQAGPLDRHQHRAQRPGRLHHQAQPAGQVPQRQADRRPGGAGAPSSATSTPGCATSPRSKGRPGSSPTRSPSASRPPSPTPGCPTTSPWATCPSSTWTRCRTKADPATLVGKGFYSGPFRVSAHTTQQLTLDAVADAWDGPPRVAGVDIKFVTDPQARLAALRTGEIDMMLYVPADGVPLIKQSPGLQFKATPSAGRVWVLFNFARPPLNEVAVRQAVSLAIDRKQIAEQVLNGAYVNSDSCTPPQSPGTCPACSRPTRPPPQAAGRRRLEGRRRRDPGQGRPASGVRVAALPATARQQAHERGRAGPAQADRDRDPPASRSTTSTPPSAARTTTPA